MNGKYKHRLDDVIFRNLWKEKSHIPLKRRKKYFGDYLIFGIYKRWFSQNDYGYIIGFMGLYLEIWFQREWIENKKKGV